MAFAAPDVRRRGSYSGRALAERRSSSEWRAAAADFAAKGEFARAIAALFSAALAELDERGLVALDPSRTPGEYAGWCDARAPKRRRRSTTSRRASCARHIRAFPRSWPISRTPSARWQASNRTSSRREGNAAAPAATRDRIVVLAIAVLTYVSVERQAAKERAQVLPDSYSTHDAKSGGYRAWFELMQREGVNVERFELRPAFLDRSVRTLVWADPLPFDVRQQFMTKSDLDALDAWIRHGGRLVYLGHDDEAAAQGLLKLPRSTAKPVRGARAYVAPQFASAGVSRYPAETKLRWSEGKRTTLLSDARGPLVVEYPYGKGDIVAAIDEPGFTNANIGRPDRARLAYALAQPQNGPIAFNESIHGFSTPEHWWAVVPRAFAIAIWCALGILLFAFAGAALRLGPPVVPKPRDPNSAAFLDALAALFERDARCAKRCSTRAARRSARWPGGSDFPTTSRRRNWLPPSKNPSSANSFSISSGFPRTDIRTKTPSCEASLWRSVFERN